MGAIVIDSQSVPSTPESNTVAVYPEFSLRLLSTVDEGGFVHLSNRRTNFSTAQQSLTASVANYITGANLLLPTAFITRPLMLKWRFNLTKTAAGVAGSSIFVRAGISGSLNDFAILSFSKPAGTAVADEGWVEIITRCTQLVQVRSLNVVGVCRMSHNLNSTGHMTIPFMSTQDSGGLDSYSLPTFSFGVTYTPGAGDITTINLVQAEAFNV